MSKTDMFIPLVALVAIWAGVGALWVIAKSAPSVNAILKSSDQALTPRVSAAVMALAAIPLVAAVAKFFWVKP